MTRRTGPSQAVRDEVYARADFACERCGNSNASTYSLHHRRPRGLGGSKDPATNSPENLLLLCGSGTTGCHGEVERSRSQSLAEGYLVRQGVDPATVPVAYGPMRKPLLLSHFEGAGAVRSNASDGGVGSTARMTPEQMRDAGMARADAVQPAEWRGLVDAVIETWAATGVPFTADDVTPLTGDSPTGSRGALGARFAYAARRGVIVRVGYIPSRRPSVHAHPIAQWQGAQVQQGAA